MTTITNNKLNKKIETGPLASDPPMSDWQKSQFAIAVKQVGAKEFREARKTLAKLKHPRANRWVEQIDYKYPSMKKRNLWPIIIGLTIAAIISLIVINRTMGNIPLFPSASTAPTQNNELAILMQVNKQAIENRITCRNYPAKPEDLFDKCAGYRLDFQNCTTSANTWDIYNKCLDDFNKQIKYLEENGYKK